MTFALYLPPLTDDALSIPADFLEQLRVDMSQAVDGDAGGTYAGAITWADTHTYTKHIKFSGDDAGARFRTSSLGDANTDLDTSTDIYLFVATPTQDRTYTLNHTGSQVPQIGNVIRVVHNILNGTNAAIFKREDATELGRIEPNSNQGWIEFVYTGGGGWIACGVGGDGVITAH